MLPGSGTAVSGPRARSGGAGRRARRQVRERDPRAGRTRLRDATPPARLRRRRLPGVRPRRGSRGRERDQRGLWRPCGATRSPVVPVATFDDIDFQPTPTRTAATRRPNTSPRRVRVLRRPLAIFERAPGASEAAESRRRRRAVSWPSPHDGSGEARCKKRRRGNVAFCYIRTAPSALLSADSPASASGFSNLASSRARRPAPFCSCAAVLTS